MSSSFSFSMESRKNIFTLYLRNGWNTHSIRAVLCITSVKLSPACILRTDNATAATSWCCTTSRTHLTADKGVIPLTRKKHVPY
jgi:hypothetical protein